MRMRPAILVHAAALLLSLVVAYLSWTHEGDEEEVTDTVVLAADADEITTVRFKSDKIDLALSRKSDKLGPFFWVELTREAEETKPKKPEPKKPEPKKPEPDPHGKGHDKGSPAAEPPGDAEKPESAGKDGPAKASSEKPEGASEAEAATPEPSAPTHLTFKAGDATNDVIEALGPLRASRIISGVDDSKLADFGLGEAAAILTVERKGRDPISFEVGSNLFGGRSVYLRDPESAKVYVVQAKPFRILRDGDRRLIERKLLAADLKDAGAVTVRAESREAKFVQHNADDNKLAYWSRGESEERDDAGDTWVRKALRLRALDFVGTGPMPEKPELRFSLVVVARDGVSTRVDVLEGRKANGDADWVATSDFLRGMVKLREHAASDLAGNVAELLEDAP